MMWKIDGIPRFGGEPPKKKKEEEKSMVLTVNAKKMVYKTMTNNWKDRNGKEQTSYKVAIETDDGIAELPCTEDVVKKVKPMTECELVLAYRESVYNNQVEKSIRVTDVVAK